ncbi:MAG TPA: hypothetical protein VFB72_18545 [Verrucomicrobiae bacterium]|nr:hypothetical protein [Verrucomicrobiae bacterium]
MKRKTMPFPTHPVPAMARVKQRLSPEHIVDVRNETRQKLLDAGLREKVKRGARIAITAGSRGIGGFLELLSGIADAIKEAGGKPFIIPAMGSHGGATPQGQTEILKRLGVTDKLGMPIRATMETIAVGTSDNGAIAHLDSIAAKADGIIVLGRTKTHPENTEGVASGLLKMITVGLGKQIGAQEAHSHGLWDSVKAVPRLTMAQSKILFGVAVVENAFRKPAIIEVVPATYDAFLDADKRLLIASKKYSAKIPFKQLDLLVVDELGKNISGTGMDLNVIGKWRLEGGAQQPDFRRIVALSLTAPSLGNGLGIGLADFTTERFMAEYDWGTTYVNLLTATEPDSMNPREGTMPLVLPSDREAIGVALYSALASPQPRVCRIKNTGLLDELWVSEALLDEVKQNSNLSVEQSPEPMKFNRKGNLF